MAKITNTWPRGRLESSKRRGVWMLQDADTLITSLAPKTPIADGRFEFSENKVRVYAGKIFIGLKFVPKTGLNASEAQKRMSLTGITNVRSSTA